MRDSTKGQTRGVLLSVLAICFIVMFLSSSIKGAYQIYFKDLSEIFGLGTGTFALSGALFGLSLGLVSPLVGALCDRYGPYRCLLTGAASASIAFLLLANTKEYELFLFSYGILAAFGFAALTFVPVGILIDKVFSKKSKGLAFSVVSNGVAIGFIVLSPLWVWINGWMPWGILSSYLSFSFLILIAVPVFLVSRAFPVPEESGSTFSTKESESITGHLKKPLFILLAVSFAGCGSSMAFIDIHLVPLVQGGELDLSGGATSILAIMLSVLGACELIGALIVGYCVAKYNSALMLAALYGLRAFSLTLLSVSDSPTVLISFAIIFGLTYMGTVIITSMICLQCYGAKIKGKMFGLLFSVHQIAVFLTAWLGGMAYDLTGDYRMTTLGVTTVCLLSVIAALALKRLRRSLDETESGQAPERFSEKAAIGNQ